MGQKKSGMFKYMKYSVIGIEMAMSVVVGAAIGYWLDQWLGTEPWMLVFWLICGVIAGFRSLYKTAKRIMKEMAEDDDQGSD
ncbi:AtpZ/AtpI family protein [bacterium]|nr:AtpZ/AtpI family protein [bacterium]